MGIGGKLIPSVPILARDGKHTTFEPCWSCLGVENLNPSLTINGSTELPFLRYIPTSDYIDANDWEEWTYGENCSIAGAGDAPTLNEGSPLFGTYDDSVLFNEAKYYQCDDTTTGNITTEDIVCEVVFRAKADAGTYRLFGKRAAAAGWIIQINAANKLVFFIQDSSGNAQAASAALTDKVWYHAICFMDRSGTGFWYINGSASAGSAISARQLTITNSTAFRIGDVNGAPYGSNIAYLAMWKKAAWLDTHAQATVASTRFQQLTGVFPLCGAGSQLATTSRTTTAFLEHYNSDSKRQMWYVGPEWIRIEEWKDSASSSIIGPHIESQHTNLSTYSRDVTAGGLGGVLVEAALHATQLEGPEGDLTLQGIVGDADDEIHGIQHNVTLTAAKYWIFCWVKKGNQNWVWLDIDILADAATWFDLDNIAVGTQGAGATEADISGPYNGNCYRIGISFTGTAAVYTATCNGATADNDQTYTGDASTANFYIDHFNVVKCDYPCSPIWTTDGTATRVKDQFRYDGGYNIGGEDAKQGVIECDVLFRTQTSSANKTVVAISDGGITTETVEMLSTSANDYHKLNIESAGSEQAAVTGSTDLADDTIHHLKSTWKTNQAKIFTDRGEEGTPDTTVTVPDDLDRLNVGMAGDATLQMNGIVGNLKIYGRYDGSAKR
jgi:hypothetical protein